MAECLHHNPPASTWRPRGEGMVLCELEINLPILELYLTPMGPLALEPSPIITRQGYAAVQWAVVEGVGVQQRGGY